MAGCMAGCMAGRVAIKCASPYASHAHKYTPLTGEVEGLHWQGALSQGPSQLPEPLQEIKKTDHTPLHQREPPEEQLEKQHEPQHVPQHVPLLFAAAAGDGEDSESNARESNGPSAGPAAGATAGAAARAAAGSLSRLLAAESTRMALLRGKPHASTPKSRASTPKSQESSGSSTPNSKESSDLLPDNCLQGYTPVPEEGEEGQELSVLETPLSVLESPGHMRHVHYKSNNPGDAYYQSNHDHGSVTAAQANKARQQQTQGNTAYYAAHHNACHNAYHSAHDNGTETEALAQCETRENMTARQAFALLNARARHAGRLTPTVT